ERTLHLQQRRPVGLVEDPAADRQQAFEAATQQLLASESEPLAESAVDTPDRPVGRGVEQPAGGLLEQDFALGRIVHLRSGLPGIPPWPRRSGSVRSGAGS